MKKIIIACGVLFALLILGVVITVMRVNPDDYRGRLVELLSQKTGRKVRLDGAIHLGLSIDGVTFSVQNAALGNPAWASRAEIAGIGTFELGIEALPLLRHRLVISTMTIKNADIQLETSLSGQNNWELEGLSQSGTVKPESVPSAKASSQPISINVKHLIISDSQITIRGRDGTGSVFRVASMELDLQNQGLKVTFQGAFNTSPITLSVQPGTDDFMANRSWPVAIDLVYASYHVQARGNASLAGRVASFDSFSIASGQSAIGGTLAANWSGTRPSFKGLLTSTHFAPNDFRQGTASGEPSHAENNKPVAAPRYVVSDQPLGCEALKSMDADIQLDLKNFVLPGTVLNQITGRVNLAAGHLDTPIKVSFGKSVLSSDIKLNAATSPAQLGIMVASPDVDLGDLLGLMGAPAFLSGIADANANLGASGDSLHALASTLTGTMDITGSGGTVSSAKADDISSSLMELFAPNGTNALNCFAARFIANKGIIHDNGILIDSVATTVAGKGGFDMQNETIGMTLRAETKLVNMGGLLPPLTVHGTFAKPAFSMDPKAVLQNVAGLFTGGGTLESGVPAIQTAPGQNACVYTITHPVASSGAIPVTGPGLQGAADKVKNISNQLMKGFFGQ